ncbi:hypothetical protein Athai_41880 [Actinocatenispora thailandica]|uniref:DUF998 domain-containing protein n=1 Tax=Actinocatenispora thailandica TaxID=227318 RepID=A0A7R7DRS1_9ACTN|nr:DUF998 domain-containing protein [Actinocatenispora thailandica]BCJ36685.1 hypothetical protein Athai_41880 [Actinocatenispora thailandica]
MTITTDSTAPRAGAATPVPARRPGAAYLALGALLGPALCTVAWIVLGLVSPGYSIGGDWISPYSAIAQPISGLGMGATAAYMNPAFVLSGLVGVAGVAGVLARVRRSGRRALRWVALVLLAASPAGLVVAGLFPLDSPVLHLAGGTMLLGLPVLGFLVAGSYLRGAAGWARFGRLLMLVASPLTLALFVLYSATFDHSVVAAGHGVAGLTQRLLCVEIFGWYAALGWRAFRRR